MTQRPIQQKQQPSEPTPWTDADLDALAAVSPSDLVQAVALWKRAAPQAFKDLLDAHVIEATSL